MPFHKQLSILDCQIRFSEQNFYPWCPVSIRDGVALTLPCLLTANMDPVLRPGTAGSIAFSSQILAPRTARASSKRHRFLHYVMAAGTFDRDRRGEERSCKHPRLLGLTWEAGDNLGKINSSGLSRKGNWHLVAGLAHFRSFDKHPRQSILY